MQQPFLQEGLPEDQDIPPEGQEIGDQSGSSFLGEDSILLENKKDDNRPRIFLLGLRKSGKSSIRHVTFQRTTPHETLFLEATTDIRVHDVANNPFLQLRIVDFPGGFEFTGTKKYPPDRLFQRCDAIVFVIDGQEPQLYGEAVEYIRRVALLADQYNKKIHYEVMVHKVDGENYSSEELKVECQRTIRQQLTDDLQDTNFDFHRFGFHLTSIYDHSIFEACSRVVQKLLPELTYLETLLDSLVQSCTIEKAFLFDVLSKVYIASDSGPVDMQTYELCSDMIDVVLDVSWIYGVAPDSKLDDEMKNTATNSSSSSSSSNSSSSSGSGSGGGGGDDVAVYDAESAAVIRLGKGLVLYLREVNKFLALVCLVREEYYEKTGEIEYNVTTFKQGIAQLVRRKEKPFAEAM